MSEPLYYKAIALSNFDAIVKEGPTGPPNTDGLELESR